MKFLNLILLSASIAGANEVAPSDGDVTSIDSEPSTSEVASVEESEEEASSSSLPSSTSSSIEEKGDVADNDGTMSYEQFQAEVEKWLSNYLEKDWLTKVISWAVDAGVLGGLFTVYLKYRKYKNKTIGQLVDEIKEQVTKQMGDDFKNLSTEQQEKLINGLETLKKSNELVIKALVLAQSKTTDSKLALLDLVAQSNTDVEVQETVKEVRQEVEKSEEQKQKVQEAVKDDYNPID